MDTETSERPQEPISEQLAARTDDSSSLRLNGALSREAWSIVAQACGQLTSPDPAVHRAIAEVLETTRMTLGE